MKIECEIEWIDDKENIDGTIKNAITEKLIERVSKRMSGEMFKEIEKEASIKLAEKVDEVCVELLERFMDKEIIVTDKWGDVQDKHENVSELLKAKFDRFLTETVDKNGNQSNNCSYGNKIYTRLHYVLDKRIKEHGDIITKDIVKEVDTKVKAHKIEIHQNAVAKIAQKIGLNK